MDDFSSIDDRDFSVSPASLLQTMLDTFSVKIEVLKPIRDSGKIIGFEYILVDEIICNDASNLNLNGKKVFELSSDSGNGFSKLVEVITTGTPQSVKSFLKVNGSVQSFKETYVKSGGFVVVFRGQTLDETDRSEEAINELYDSLLKKNQELSRLSKEIKTFNIVAAHDYKETLQQLYTNFEYIITNDARNLSNIGKGNIRRAQSAIQRMNLLTDDINNYFRLYDLDIKLSPVDSSEILRAVLNVHQSKLEQYNAKVEFANLPILRSNTELLSLLFTNLIDNAIKFRSLVVPLVIKLEYSPADKKNAGNDALKNTQYGIISVTDNGIGFSEAEAEKIFEIFYKRAEGKERGTGIGLAVCKKVMALHDGFITAKGQPDRGASFDCYFPLGDG